MRNFGQKLPDGLVHNAEKISPLISARMKMRGDGQCIFSELQNVTSQYPNAYQLCTVKTKPALLDITD